METKLRFPVNQLYRAELRKLFLAKQTEAHNDLTTELVEALLVHHIVTHR